MMSSGFFRRLPDIADIVAVMLCVLCFVGCAYMVYSIFSRRTPDDEIKASIQAQISGKAKVVCLEGWSYYVVEGYRTSSMAPAWGKDGKPQPCKEIVAPLTSY